MVSVGYGHLVHSLHYNPMHIIYFVALIIAALVATALSTISSSFLQASLVPVLVHVAGSLLWNTSLPTTHVHHLPTIGPLSQFARSLVISQSFLLCFAVQSDVSVMRDLL